MNNALERFLAQNDIAARTITPEQREAIEDFAEHHAGGAYVLGVPMQGDRYMKLHDSWGDPEDKVLVHVYDPDGDDGEPQTERYFDTGFEAVQTFLRLAEGEESEADDLALAIEECKEEILVDVGQAVSSSGETMPVTVSSFSELHDYVDANEYAGLCDDKRRAHWAHTGDLVNQLQNAVHHWLASGEMRVEWTARFLFDHFADISYAHTHWGELTEDFRQHWRNHARRLLDSFGLAVPPTNEEIARRWVTPAVADLFRAEISNERQGGVSPATVSSTIDSVSQGLPFPEDVDVSAVLTSLLMIRDLLPGDTEVEDLL